MIFYHDYHFCRLNLKGKAEKKRNNSLTALDNYVKSKLISLPPFPPWYDCADNTQPFMSKVCIVYLSLTILRQTLFISHYCDIVLINSMLVVIQFEILINSESDLLENFSETDHLLFQFICLADHLFSFQLSKWSILIINPGLISSFLDKTFNR